MFWINLIITIITASFTYQEYNKGRISWAIFWAFLFGWDLHTVLITL